MKRKPINVFLNDAEKILIKEKADIVGMKISQFIRQTAMNSNIAPPLDKATRNALASYGNNINQIAKIGNTYKTIADKDIQALRQQAIEIIRLIRKEYK